MTVPREAGAHGREGREREVLNSAEREVRVGERGA